MPLLLLIFLVAIAGAGLARLGESWPLQMQREREAELLFRGQQFRAALQAYQAASPPGGPDLPATLEELLEDRRAVPPRHWLRQIYADPFTGLPDWQLLRDAQGGITGLHSRSRQPARRIHDLPVPVQAAAGSEPTVGDWRFVVPPQPQRPARPAVTRP